MSAPRGWKEIEKRHYSRVVQADSDQCRIKKRNSALGTIFKPPATPKLKTKKRKR